MSDGHSSKAPKGAAPSSSSAKATARQAAAAAASSTSDGGWHSGITPAISPTSSGPAHLPHSSSTPASATPKGSPPTVINVPARREGPRGSAGAGGAAATGAVPPLSISIGSANSSGSASPPSLPPAGSSAAPSPKTDPPPRPPRQASTTSTREDSPADDDRGWDAVMDGRFRIALMHRFAEDVDGESGNGSGSGPQLSAFANCLPEEMNADAAAECEEDANRTPTHDAFCNQCQPGEPRIEVDVEASLVNAINSAYTSTGYPFVVTAGNARGAVYGSFVDTSNPTISSLELPPQQSYIVAPSYTGGQAPAQGGVTEMDTLLAIYWARGDRMMTTAGTAAAAAVAASQGKAASKDAKATSPGSAPPPSSAGPAGTPHNPAVARTIAHHLSQYPEGIHGIHSSMHLRTVLVEGKLPAEPAFAPSAPLHTMAAVPLAVAGGNVIAPPASTSPPPAPPAAAPAAAAAAGGTENAADDATAAAAAAAAGGPPASTSPTTAMPPNGEANVPPLPRPLESNAPVQFTLVSASTFNHLTVYVVAHQDGKMLYNAALQSLSASIATRKVTAHQLILVGREEINAVSSDPLAAVTQPPPRRTKISFANVPATGSEAAMLLHSKTSRFAGADAARRTVSAAPVRFTVEPHLLFGNQNGDLFVFSMLQERIVQHINFNAGSQQVSSSIASGNSGVGSKLICSPVSAIVEVQNGIEKKITSMVQYATVAKRNHRSSFECDDVPSSFTPTGAAAPSHYYYPVPPSLYAVGFDNGQMLLICVTCEGGWMLRHFSSQYFGLRPIHAIAVRVPPFFTRLWTSSLPPIARLDAKTAALPAARSIEKTVTALVTPEQALLVHEEDSHIAAVACNGGVIALVKLPGLEILSSVATTDYNAVGEILALQWTATATSHLLTPDVLVATGEDDTMTAFQLVSQFLISAGESNHNHNANNGLETVSHLSSTESILAGGRLRILEKKKFHRSWVNRLHLLPVVLPATPSRAGSRSDPRGVARRNSSNSSTGPKRAVCAATGGGMPHYLGVCLIATSYDRRTSFWPYIFANAEEYADESGVRRSGEASTANGSLTLPPAENSDFLNASASLTGAAGATAGGTAAAAVAAMSAAAPDHYVLVDGPTAAYPLHTELVVSVAAAGGGTSFFLTTVCCRGKVKFWSVSVKV